MKTKHIFITGGVVSSLGKGITGAALAFLLEQRGFRVAMQKLDPYLNVDPGTMSPYQHGEVFVTDDGAETDLDLGHYERIAGIACSKASNYTSGKIYSNVIARERAGGYLGGTVQVIPHITDEIKSAMRSLHGENVDIAISEIGGTTGDIESLPFLEAARQFKLESDPGDVIFLHLTLVPYIKAAKELKTKPSQHSVAALRSIGVTPDILVCRSEVPMEEEHLRKLSLFCNVPRSCVIEELDVQNSIYEVPLELERQNLDVRVLQLLRLEEKSIHLEEYKAWLENVLHPVRSCRIAVVGKYIRHQDAYKSIYEALHHAGIKHRCKVELIKIESEELEQGDVSKLLGEADGILVPGGFGARGIAGKVRAIEYARTHKIPFLGICLGMQCAVIEFARNVLNWQDADSSEFNPDSKHPVIDLMEEQRSVSAKGGTMRLGAYDCRILPGTLAEKCYASPLIRERHRHRYEYNPACRTELEKAGLKVSGINPERNLVEMVELPGHPYFIACQFHPEFKSRPQKAHPLFDGLIEAAWKGKENAQKN
ncbi:MAG: CTP synthase [Lentisphaeria bacterium]|nr:CTP synthase [Lentisphaeria bacterium]